jgi:hypothetical protein
MAWLPVVVAGVFETGFAVLLKQSHWDAAGRVRGDGKADADAA